MLHDFRADGVVYLELRTTPISSALVTRDEYVNLVLSCIEKFEHRDEMVTYLIFSVDRRNKAEQAIEVVDLALKFRNRGVVGIDLCGDPAKGDVSTFAPAFAKAKKAGLKITLHLAEIAASSSKNELEILLSFRPDRLRHVICVPEEVKRKIEQGRLGLKHA